MGKNRGHPKNKMGVISGLRIRLKGITEQIGDGHSFIPIYWKRTPSVTTIQRILFPYGLTHARTGFYPRMNRRRSDFLIFMPNKPNGYDNMKMYSKAGRISDQ
jgi:hypothetical protein